ncbi:MAG: hypothetical protein WBV82_06885 [Myxococcaceae bacterium]
MGRMRGWTGWVGALVLGLVGCGPITPIPPGDVNGGDAGLPPHEMPPTATSMWPLTAGSTWTYAIDDPDPLKGKFEKVVTVVGEEPIPGMNGTAVVTKSVQLRTPQLEEKSWQLVSGGVVFRVREEDRKDGVLARVMTWQPTVMKSLAEAQPQGWSHAATVIESELDGNGVLVDQKQKEFVWTVEAVNETVTTAAGTWNNAIRLRRGRPDKVDWETRTYWLVPGVGKVLETGERREELLRYDVRP